MDSLVCLVPSSLRNTDKHMAVFHLGLLNIRCGSDASKAGLCLCSLRSYGLSLNYWLGILSILV